MGIKDFSKTFSASSEDLKMRDFRERKIAIDGNNLIYRASLGIKEVARLTDKYGRPTAHINVLFANIIEFKKESIGQVWTFDFMEEEKDLPPHNPLKIRELMKRQKRKEDAQKRIEELKIELEEVDDKLFSDSEEEEVKEEKKERERKIIRERIEKQKKVEFVVDPQMVWDIRFILTCLDIPYVDAPRGFEGEQIASKLNSEGIVDYILSSDMDVLLFGGRRVIRKQYKKKRYDVYDLEEILERYSISHNDLIKIGVILGSDFAPKTKGVGPKTIMRREKKKKKEKEKKEEEKRRFETIELTPEQKEAVRFFEKPIPPLQHLDWKNWAGSMEESERASFTSRDKINILIDWLVDERGFSRERVIKQIKKVAQL
jgi:flap endonuclease-1